MEKLFQQNKGVGKSIAFQVGKADEGKKKETIVTSNHDQVEKVVIGPGLYNLGNTCFMNSVLQCLTHSPPLRNYLMNLKHNCTKKDGQFCIVCTMQNHVKQCVSNSVGSTKKSIAPRSFASNLTKIAKHFRHGRQEDSHEFLRYLVDGLVCVLFNRSMNR